MATFSDAGRTALFNACVPINNRYGRYDNRLVEYSQTTAAPVGRHGLAPDERRRQRQRHVRVFGRRRQRCDTARLGRSGDAAIAAVILSTAGRRVVRRLPGHATAIVGCDRVAAAAAATAAVVVVVLHVHRCGRPQGSATVGERRVRVAGPTAIRAGRADHCGRYCCCCGPRDWPTATNFTTKARARAGDESLPVRSQCRLVTR